MTRTYIGLSVVTVLALLALLAACGGSTSMGALAPLAPLASKCRLGASQTSVLVTEWSAAEKANLEAQLASGGGAVAVAFSGCHLRLLPACELSGAYLWQRTTPGTDIVEISSEAELYTKLPLGAVSLAGELSRSGTLYVETTVAGHRRLAGVSTAEVPAAGGCEDATHVVSGLSLGAFVLSAADQASAQASLEVPRLGEASGRRAGSARLVRSAGHADACWSTTDQGPAGDCGSPLQVFLSPIPGRAEPEGPPGTVQVDFVSASSDTRWDVYIDDQATCTTPCSRWVYPERPLVLRTRDDTPDKLQIDRLNRELGPLQIAAHARSQGKLATGITFTALGGLTVVSGITLSAIGCSSDDRAGMCTAGVISLGASSIVTAGAIWLLLDSMPRLAVRPLFGRPLYSGGGSLQVGPGFVAGTF